MAIHKPMGSFVKVEEEKVSEPSKPVPFEETVVKRVSLILTKNQTKKFSDLQEVWEQMKKSASEGVNKIKGYKHKEVYVEDDKTFVEIARKVDPKNKTIYEGSTRKDLPHGLGSLLFVDKNQYQEGIFLKGKFVEGYEIQLEEGGDIKAAKFIDVTAKKEEAYKDQLEWEDPKESHPEKDAGTGGQSEPMKSRNDDPIPKESKNEEVDDAQLQQQSG